MTRLARALPLLAVLPLAALPLAVTACDAENSATETKTVISSSTAAAAPECPPEQGTSEPHRSFSAAPPECLVPGAHYSATFTTDVGTFAVDLDSDSAPRTVNNFVFLARNRFYDGLTFHRVVPGFVVQGGDPKGDGTGGPGYEFADELPQQGQYRLGSLAMANSGPNSNGSQFFVITGEQGASLPPQYSLFGQVTAGLDTVETIEADGSGQGAPAVVHTMQKVGITQTPG